MLAQQLWPLGNHSAIYGLGAVVSRLIGVLLLPVVTRYLDRSDLGAVDTLVALSIGLVVVLRPGLSVAGVRAGLGDAGAAAATGLVLGLILAEPISEFLFSTHAHANLVRAGFVLLWAQMNYEQLTALFRVEERSV